VSVQLVVFWQEKTREAYAETYKVREENARLMDLLDQRNAEIARLKSIDYLFATASISNGKSLVAYIAENANLKAEVDRLKKDQAAANIIIGDLLAENKSLKK
jgi:hypothetical protein